MSNHTLGPWEIKRHFDPGYKFISAPTHFGLAQVVWCIEDEDRSPECEANAHLIAAAPQLLGALQSAVWMLTNSYSATHSEMKHFQSVIAKAKGE